MICSEKDHLGFFINVVFGWIALSVKNTMVKVSRENSDHRLSYDHF